MYVYAVRRSFIILSILIHTYMIYLKALQSYHLSLSAFDGSSRQQLVSRGYALFLVCTPPPPPDEPYLCVSVICLLFNRWGLDHLWPNPLRQRTTQINHRSS